MPLDVPKAVVAEFEAALGSKAARAKRLLMAHLTHHPNHTTEITMTPRRNAITKRAEPTPVPATTAPVKPAKMARPKGTAKPKRKPAKKATPSARSAVTAKYTRSKLAVQGKCRIGAVVLYRGRLAKVDGERVKVVGHEGRGGVFVEFRNKKFVVSPNALLPKPKAAQ